MTTIYGYVRVSSKDQNEDRQMISMAECKIDLKNIYIDKQSGKDFDRPAYKKLMEKIKSKDILIIKSIDRLGRNYAEILEQWRIITKEKNVAIRVLDMPLLNVQQHADLTGTLIADIVLQLLSYVAQTERENIKQRQKEGIAAAKTRGVKFGRPSKQIPSSFFAVYKCWAGKKINSRQASELLNVSQTTFLKWTKKFCQKR